MIQPAASPTSAATKSATPSAAARASDPSPHPVRTSTPVLPSARSEEVRRRVAHHHGARRVNTPLRGCRQVELRFGLLARTVLARGVGADVGAKELRPRSAHLIRKAGEPAEELRQREPPAPDARLHGHDGAQEAVLTKAPDRRPRARDHAVLGRALDPHRLHQCPVQIEEYRTCALAAPRRAPAPHGVPLSAPPARRADPRATSQKCGYPSIRPTAATSARLR